MVCQVVEKCIVHSGLTHFSHFATFQLLRLVKVHDLLQNFFILFSPNIKDFLHCFWHICTKLPNLGSNQD